MRTIKNCWIERLFELRLLRQWINKNDLTEALGKALSRAIAVSSKNLL